MENQVMNAVMSGDFLLLQQLLNDGKDPDQIDSEGRSPLMAALYKNLVPIAELLIDKGANIHRKDQSNYSVLYYAAVHGHFEATYLLIEKGLEIDLENPDVQEIIELVRERNFTVISELLTEASKI